MNSHRSPSEAQEELFREDPLELHREEAMESYKVYEEWSSTQEYRTEYKKQLYKWVSPVRMKFIATDDFGDVYVFENDPIYNLGFWIAEGAQLCVGHRELDTPSQTSKRIIKYVRN